MEKLGKEEAAKILGISIRTLERYVRENKIGVTYVPTGRKPKPVFDPAEIEAFKKELDTPTVKGAIVVAQTRKIVKTTNDKLKNDKRQFKQIFDRLKETDLLYDQEFLQRCAEHHWLLPTWQLAVIQSKSAKTLVAKKSHEFRGFFCNPQTVLSNEIHWEIIANNQ